ncbi:Uncharacterised protein [Candidatus Tiddalikarchaeum anstoanum]|nr:Uncharacterised protein [Candidatus Tiddalikarchaeum anstoanum]
MLTKFGNKIKQFAYGIRIMFNNEEYHRVLNHDEFLKRKTEKYRQKLQMYKKESFNRGKYEGQDEYKRYINDNFSNLAENLGITILPGDCCLEDVLLKIKEAESFKKLLGKKETRYDALTALCMKKMNSTFTPYINQLTSYVKEYSPEVVEKVEKGVLNGLINYLSLCCNLVNFDDYALLDTSYISKFRETNSSKALRCDNLHPNIKGMILPVAAIKEYYAMINEYRDIRIAKRVKSDIIQLLSNPNLMIIPMSKSLEYLDKETVDIFCDENNGHKKYHKADLQIISFYKKFGHQFSNLYLLAIDQDLWAEMEKLSKSRNNLSIISNKLTKIL